MNYRRYLSPAEDGAPSPQLRRGRDREWVVIAYAKGRHKPLGLYYAQNREAAVGLAKRRHPNLQARFRAELADGHPRRREKDAA